MYSRQRYKKHRAVRLAGKLPSDHLQAAGVGLEVNLALPCSAERRAGQEQDRHHGKGAFHESPPLAGCSMVAPSSAR